MTFKQYAIIYDLLSRIVEEMKHEEQTIKEIYGNNAKYYEKNETYQKLYNRRLEIELICDSIESMEI